MEYIEIAVDSTNKRNVFIKKSDLETYSKKVFQENRELYRSYYLYDQDILEHFKIRKTCSNFKGKYYLDRILFDIDFNTNDEITLTAARLFYDKLREEWELSDENIEIWYSGRGYHIVIPDIFHFEPSNNLPANLKTTLNKYFPEADNSPLISTGLIRYKYSINNKTKLYKVPLTIDEFNQLDTNEIKEISKSNIQREIKNISENIKLNYNKLIVKNPNLKNLVNIKDTTRIVTCVQNMYNEGAYEGFRHINMLRMVGTWKMQGLGLDEIKTLIRKWANNTLTDYEIEHQVNYLYDKSYTPGCNDSVRIKYCDSKCIYYKSKNYITEVSNNIKLEAGLIKFIREDRTANAFNLKDIFNIPKEYWSYPGELITVIGPSKIGKTAIIQNIIVKLKYMKILYINFEFSPVLSYRRFLQIEHNMTKDNIYNYYNINNNGLSENLAHIFIMQIAPKVDDLPKFLSSINPKIIIIDTFDELETDGYRDYNNKSEEVVKKLKKYAEQLNIIIIAINHIPKSQCYDDKGKIKKLNIHSARGSSAIAAKSDKILAFEGNLNDYKRTLSSLAARDEAPFTIDFTFNPETFRMEQIIYE